MFFYGPILAAAVLLLSGCERMAWNSAEKLQKKGQTAAAARAFEAFARKYENSDRACDALWEAARLHAEVPDYPAVRRTLRRLVLLYPGCEHLSEGREMLWKYADWWPLAEGNLWVEVDSQSGGKQFRAQTSCLGASGNGTFRLERKIFSGGKLMETRVFQIVRREPGAVEEMAGEETIRWLTLPPEPGQTWRSGGVQFRVVSASETVRTRAGEFTRCLKIQRRLAGASAWNYDYYAPFVGKVLMTSAAAGEPEVRQTELASHDLKSP